MHCAPSTAHNIATSKMAAVLLSSAKRTNKGRFCRAKAFIRHNNVADRPTASWFAIKKQENERNVRDPEALDYGGCEGCGKALRLSNCINEPVSGLGSLLYICRSNSESGELNIFGTNKIHRRTRTTRGRPVNTRSAAEFTFCCV